MTEPTQLQYGISQRVQPATVLPGEEDRGLQFARSLLCQEVRGLSGKLLSFAYTYIVSNEYSDRIKFRPLRGNKLIWPGFHRYPAKAAKRTAVCPG